MERNQPTLMIKIITTVTFSAMVIANALANALPINGLTTGQISDFYPNLFAPAGWTFAIWGLIYLLLAVYTLYQLGVFQDNIDTVRGELLNEIGILFSISSVANAAWIFAWHYRVVPLSLVLIVVILVCLILINQKINKEQLSAKEKLFVGLPFSVYFGWITVATIANATILLVSLNWQGFGLTEPTWASIVIILGFLIGAVTMLKNRDVAYGLVIVWAYAGILFKHTSTDGFGGQYPVIINITIVCIGLLLLGEAYLLISKKRNGNII